MSSESLVLRWSQAGAPAWPGLLLARVAPAPAAVEEAEGSEDREGALENPDEADDLAGGKPEEGPDRADGEKRRREEGSEEERGEDEEAEGSRRRSAIRPPRRLPAPFQKSQEPSAIPSESSFP